MPCQGESVHLMWSMVDLWGVCGGQKKRNDEETAMGDGKKCAEWQKSCLLLERVLLHCVFKGATQFQSPQMEDFSAAEIHGRSSLSD